MFPYHLYQFAASAVHSPFPPFYSSDAGTSFTFFCRKRVRSLLWTSHVIGDACECVLCCWGAVEEESDFFFQHNKYQSSNKQLYTSTPIHPHLPFPTTFIFFSQGSIPSPFCTAKPQFQIQIMQPEGEPYRPFRIDRQNLNIALNRQEGHASPIEQLSQIPMNQLQQDVGTIFCKQFRGVVSKFCLVLFPVGAEEKVNYLRNWDLWGPFLMGIAFLLIIGTDQRFFAIVIALFYGAFMVNFNIRALGGRMSYFQALSVMGYSMFPLIFTTVILKILTLFKIKYMAVIMVAQFSATLWAIISARAFTVINIQSTRRFVAVLPISIVYFYIASHLIFYSYYSEAWQEGGEGQQSGSDS